MKNSYGSEVVDGFKCKPKIKDPNKPIMSYKYHLFLCDGGRCEQNNKSKELRALTKEMNLHRGKDRVKITRSSCMGSCRFSDVAVIFAKNSALNSCVWLKSTENYSKEKWEKIFSALENDIDLENILESNDFIEMSEA